MQYVRKKFEMAANIESPTSIDTPITTATSTASLCGKFILPYVKDDPSSPNSPSNGGMLAHREKVNKIYVFTP
jgi:hypothetical protein